MKAAGKGGILSFCLAALLSLSICKSAEAAEYKFNMSYIFFSDSSSYTSLVDNTQDSLNEVSPNYFTLKSDGSLALTASVSTAFVDDMHARGIKVVPFLTNEWSRPVGKAALAAREALAKDLAEAVTAYRLDGVNIDIENVTSSEREAYVDFIRLLRSILPPGKVIAVSVAANPWGAATGWQGSYDYVGLSRYCDYLMVMAYDEHYYGGQAGPISSYSFVEKSIKYAVSVAPKDKIVLGLPFYGRIWSQSGGFPNGFGVTNLKIAQLLKDYGGTVQVDPVSKSSRAVITIRPGDPKPVLGGQVLAAGTYSIWYESEASIKAKLELVSEYEIKGTGSWALGQETRNTWNYYKLRLNNCAFTDIETYWAKDFILNAYLKNWMTGVCVDSFSPEQPLTRAQAAAVLVRRVGLTPALNPGYSFDDCIGTWAQPYIETARKYHIITGVDNNLFNPDTPITQAEIAVMLRNALALERNAGTGFGPDFSTGSASWLYISGAIPGSSISAGYLNGFFQPDGLITRGEMAVLISGMPVSSPVLGSAAPGIFPAYSAT